MTTMDSSRGFVQKHLAGEAWEAGEAGSTEGDAVGALAVEACVVDADEDRHQLGLEDVAVHRHAGVELATDNARLSSFEQVGRGGPHVDDAVAADPTVEDLKVLLRPLRQQDGRGHLGVCQQRRWVGRGGGQGRRASS